MYTFQKGDYVIGKGEKGRDLPKISGVFKNGKMHPESHEPTSSGDVVSGDPTTKLNPTQWSNYDWSSVTKPTGQVSGVIGVDAWGNPVNMDLWETCKITGESFGTVGTVCLNDVQNATTKGYLGQINGGQIEGQVPIKVKLVGDSTFLDVTSMYGTFYGINSLMTSPVIPNGITNLTTTFCDCSNLITAPSMPSSVVNMFGTFYNCRSLTTVPMIPSNVTNMTSTFYGCANLVSVATIPSSVTALTNTFKDCRSLLTAPVILNGVTAMNSTFDGCANLATVPVIPSSVVDMTNTFNACRSLITAPIIPSSVTNMTNTFNGCANLLTVRAIPNSVLNMTSTFNGCLSLVTAPTIPSSVIYMQNTFYNCPKLSGSIDIQANPTQANATNCFTGAATTTSTNLALNYSTTNRTLIDYFMNNRGTSKLIIGVAK